MKKRKKIFRLLQDKLSGGEGKLPTVVIRGSQSGQTLYEGSFFYVPFLLCSDYVLQYEESGGVLTIVSTCSPC